MLSEGQLTNPLVSCDWLNKNINLEDLILLDASVVSKTSEASKEYIPNSRIFNLKEKFCDLDSEFPNTIPSQEQFQEQARQLGINKDSIVVVYDDKGLYWSPRVWWLFRTFGFDNVAVLDGGLPEWKRKDFTTVPRMHSAAWQKGTIVADYQPEKMCYFEDIKRHSKDGNALILDARSSRRFTGQDPEPRVGLRSGAIPKSKNLPYTELFNGYCLKSKAELQTIFDTFNIENRAVVFSCGSGITACILALAASVLGYDKLTVYDGSWTEYGTLTV